MRITVRLLRPADLPTVARIERRITGSRRTSSLVKNLRKHLASGDRRACLAAVAGGQVVGFIVGEIRPWEFGEDREIGWVRVVGVDPDYQGTGVGRLLGERLLRYFRSRGVRRARTMVEWDAGDVIAYFRSLGFSRGNGISLETDLR